MSENIDGGSTESTDTSASGDIDAQLAEMHGAENATPEPEAKEPEAEKPEVKKVVPLAALHEERRERQALQRQIAENTRVHQEQMARINQRLEQMMTPQKQLPSREEQPVEYLDHRLDQLTQAQQQILQRDQQRDQQAVQRQQYETVANAVVQSAHAFKETTPDFPQALAHLNESRVRQLAVLGVPEEQARVQASQELDQAALQWTVQGKNAAQVAYEFAKAQGYQPKTGQTPEQKIAAQQKGTAAAKSLGSGGAVTGKLTAEALADMSDEDFSKLSESDWRKAMGG
jgi:hypothetical protein